MLLDSSTTPTRADKKNQQSAQVVYEGNGVLQQREDDSRRRADSCVHLTTPRSFESSKSILLDESERKHHLEVK